MRTNSTRKLDVDEISYHRNGICGLGFYVAVVKEKEGGETRKMLVIRFPNIDQKAGAVVCAAFDLAKLAKHDIKFGSNSYRGDHYSEVMDDVINIRETMT